jgi:hypothetical protein
VDQVVSGVDVGEGLRERRGVKHVASHDLGARANLRGELCRPPRQAADSPSAGLERFEQPAADVPAGAGDEDYVRRADRFAFRRVDVVEARESVRCSSLRWYAARSRSPFAAIRRAAATVFGTGSPQAAAVSANRVGFPSAVVSGGSVFRP